jgi:hypothetical protein
VEEEDFKMQRNEIYGNQHNRETLIDFTPVLGTWMNSNTKTRWIEKFTLTKHDEQIIMHAYGAESPQDWGETEVTPFVDNMNHENAFCARYDRDSVESFLAANMNKGLCIIAGFHKFKDDKQTDFCREFYYRLE